MANKWEDLSMSDRQKMIRLSRQAGITSLKDMKLAYNEAVHDNARVVVREAPKAIKVKQHKDSSTNKDHKESKAASPAYTPTKNDGYEEWRKSQWLLGKDASMGDYADMISRRSGVPFDQANVPSKVFYYINHLTPGNSNFAIVDKSVDSMYYFNKEKELLAREPVITGADKDTNRIGGLSMREFFKKYDTSSHEEYFKYLQDRNQRVTPVGRFQISNVRENVAENPDILGNLFNAYFRPDRYNDIKKSRLRDYGSQQKILTFINENGVSMSNAIHGTDNPVREAVFNQKNSKDVNRKLSNGCINVDDESCAFDLLKKGDNILVLGDKDETLESPWKDFSSKIKKSKKNSLISAEKRNIYDTLIQRGISPDAISDEMINFITAVGEKESKFMRSPYARVEQYFPDMIAKSKGTFQINPKTFNDYIPSDYKGSFDDQVLSLYNFYAKERGNAVDYGSGENTNMYDKYNTGSFELTSDNSKKFNKIFNEVEGVKAYGGNLYDGKSEESNKMLFQKRPVNASMYVNDFMKPMDRLEMMQAHRNYANRDINSEWYQVNKPNYNYTNKDSVITTIIPGVLNKSNPIPKRMVEELTRAAINTNQDPFLLNGLALQESTYGWGRDPRKEFQTRPNPLRKNANTRDAIVSNWKTPEENWIEPLDKYQARVNNKLTDQEYRDFIESKSGKKDFNKYMDKNPKLNLSDVGVYETAIKKFNTGTYNPNKPTHTQDVKNAARKVKENKELSEYINNYVSEYLKKIK